VKPADVADLAALEVEIAAFRALRDVLRDEQEALRRVDTETLAQLVPVKLEKLAVLASLARKRGEAMRHAGVPDSRAGMDLWLSRHPFAERGKSLFRELLDLAHEALGLNTLSRRLATVQYRHFERASAALRRAVGQEDLYGADGRPRHQGAQRTLAAI
jgi:flagellar biosynthesis/type III secretory pathway chaperone